MVFTVLSDDPYLVREVTLLLSPNTAATEPAGADLLIVDADTRPLPEGRRAVVIGYKRPASLPAEAIFCERPFSTVSFRSLCLSLLSEESMALTPTEEKLLACLREANGEVVSRASLIRAGWGDGGDDGKLNLYMHYLRKKTEADGKKRIFSVHGKGYRYQC